MREVIDEASPNVTWPALPIISIKGITIVVATTCMVLTLGMRPMEFNKFPMEALLGLFTKLIGIAVFIERTVEVLLTPWRGPRSLKLTARLKQAKAKLENKETDSALEVSNAQDELREYKGETKQIAFLIALALGMTISAVGLRGLEFFLDPNSLPTPSSEQPAVLYALASNQAAVFRAIDVLVTGALLAGKADGLHRMGLVFTSYMDKSSEKVKGAT
jgi:hypothetical protein